MSDVRNCTAGQGVGNPELALPGRWSTAGITQPSPGLGSEGERHAGNNFILFFKHLHFFRWGESALLPASTVVLTISLIWMYHRPLRKCPSALWGGCLSSALRKKVKELLLGIILLVAVFLHFSLSLQGRRSWVKNRNQNLESAHPKNNGSILLKKCLDCWCVYFSSFSEIWGQSKIGSKESVCVCACVCVCKCAHMCANRELLSLRVQDAPVMSLPTPLRHQNSLLSPKATFKPPLKWIAGHLGLI